MPIEHKNQKAENIYPFIIDCSLDKKGNIFIYEVQPFIFSGLGNNASDLAGAFEKAFPEISIEVDSRIKNRYFTSGIAAKKCLFQIVLLVYIAVFILMSIIQNPPY